MILNRVLLYSIADYSIKIMADLRVIFNDINKVIAFG